MKVVILAGGRGTRFGTETRNLPKALVPVAGQPVVLHVMDIFARQGYKEFVIALGYRGDQIKSFFLRRCTSVPI